MAFNYSKYFLLILFLFSFLNSFSQSRDTLNIYNLSLEELIKLRDTGVSSDLEKQLNELIGVASKSATSSKKTPSIVSVITEEEIKNLGARELMDILRLIPGFDFALDVQGAVGIGIRGNWANEGKTLLLLDGQEMNETLYGTIFLGNNFNINQIKKIEIIRGPGSAIYGGYASYGVINIVTKNGQDYNGLNLTLQNGQMSQSYARRNISFGMGKEFKNGLDISLNGLIGEGNRSQDTYTDLDGNAQSMKNVYSLNPANLNLGIKYKNLQFRSIYDQLKTKNFDNFGAIWNVNNNDFQGFYNELKYDLPLTSKMTISAKINHKYQIPWQSGPTEVDGFENQKIAQRSRINVLLNYNISKKINYLFGIEGFRDEAYSKIPASRDTSLITWFNGNQKVSFINLACFTEFFIKNRIANLIVGGRFDQNSSFGNAIVPRIGITKKAGDFNFKLLYSHAFRAPAIENINTAFDGYGKIKPEISQVAEFELGWHPTKDLQITGNLFYILTKKTIVYSIDTITLLEGYNNFSQSGSVGAEIEIKYRKKWGYFTGNYAYYDQASLSRINNYNVYNSSSAYLAFAQHKINLYGSVKVNDHIFISPSLNILGKRFGYDYDPNNPNGELKSFAPTYFLNLNIGYNNLIIKGLDVSIACFDLLNQKQMFIQPYNSQHTPLPGLSREIIGKIAYTFSTNSK